MVIGYCEGGLFFASDQLALIDSTSRFTYLKDGDVVSIKNNEIEFYDENGKKTNREIVTSKLKPGQISKRGFPHLC